MEIINIIAIIVGPLLAVLITLWWQERKEKRDAKLRLFVTLMAFRKSYPVSYEFANQLNLIDVVFADTPKVAALWHKYYSLLQRQNPDTLQQQEQTHKYLELMSTMAAALGFHHLQQTDIDKFYIPQVHMNQTHLNWECQNEWLRVLKSTNRLVVEPKQLEQKAIQQ